MKTFRLVSDDGMPGPATPELKAARAARDARNVAMVFLDESMSEPPGARRERVRELVTLLLSRALAAGDGDVTPAELFDELKALRAAYEPAGRFGA
jgi:hypothetical protein